MTHEAQEIVLTLSDFNQSINPFFLTFRSPSLEHKYREKRIDPLRTMRFFRILFIILIVLIALRRIETLIFTYLGVPGEIRSKTVETIKVIVLVSVCLLESIIAISKKLWMAKGFFFMSYIFFFIAYGATGRVMLSYDFFWKI